jgi:Glutathione S-transferase, C-terminal domain
MLAKHPFLMGDTFTDADLRLFPTVVRYDAVYNGLFRCTRRRIAADCPRVHAWMQRVWRLPGHGGLNVRGRSLPAFARRRSLAPRLYALRCESWLCCCRCTIQNVCQQPCRAPAAVHRHLVTARLLQVCDTYNVAAAQKSYYGQLFPLNPSNIIPRGPTAADLGLEGGPDGEARASVHQLFYTHRAEVAA